MNAVASAWIPIVQTLVGGLLAIGAVAVTQLWTTKRDTTKRQIDIAEDVLAAFYEARDVIAYVRSAGGTSNEGRTRQRSEHESAEESQILDNAFVVIERYQKREEVFNNLRAKRYRFMAIFRGKAHEPFDDMEAALLKVFAASHMLGRHYWKRQGRVHMEPEAFERHLKEMQDLEAIFWAVPGQDVVSPIVEGAIQKVEAIADKAAKEYADPAIWASRWKAFKAFAEGKSDETPEVK